MLRSTTSRQRGAALTARIARVMSLRLARFAALLIAVTVLLLALLLTSRAEAAITFISEAEANADTVSLPTFAAGDIGIVMACRTGSITAPALPAGWTTIRSGSAGSGGSGTSGRMGYRELQSGDTAIGTWTNATQVMVIVLRGQAAGAGAIGGSAISGSASSNVINLPTVTMTTTDGTSWVALGGCHFSATDVNTATLAGATNRTGVTTTNTAVFTAENVASWTSTNTSTVNATASRLGVSAEIQAAVTGVVRHRVTQQ